jgi:hypothetical protein
MSDAPAFPSAVILGLWLNAATTGSVSRTDAANAMETITDQVEIGPVPEWPDMKSTSWLDLVRRVTSSGTPVAIALPIDGDPAGVPPQVLPKIQRNSGVVAIDKSLMLVKNLDECWVLMSAENAVIHHDLSQARRLLIEQVVESSAKLAASDLVGDETEILKALDAFRSLHLPPHLSNRSTESLETAAKILIVARGAVSTSVALHSPSLDRLRLHHLEQLVAKSRIVLQSVITT